MDIMLNPAHPVKEVHEGKTVYRRGEKVTVTAKEGKEKLETMKYNRPLWVEYDEESAPPVEADNAEGGAEESDKED